MTRNRNRLLITLALFAIAFVTVVSSASAARHLSDGTVSSGGSVADHQRPRVGPLSGDPDITGGTAPNNTQKLGPQSAGATSTSGGPLSVGDLIRLVGKTWTMWLLPS